MTSDPHDPNAPSPAQPRGNPESVVGSDSALGLAPPPPEEVSTGSSIFDHHVRTVPTGFAQGTPNLMRGEGTFGGPDGASVDPSEEIPAEEPPVADAELSVSEVDEPGPEVDHETALPNEELGAATTDSAALESPLDGIASTSSGEIGSAPESDVAMEGIEADEMGLTVSDDGTTEHAQETEAAVPAESWPAESSFESPAEAEPAAEAEAVPSTSPDDDQDALAGLGALASGATAGMALAEDSPWGADTTSATADSSSTYRPPTLPAAPKRDFVKLLLISYAVLVTVAAGLLWKRLNDRTVNEQRLESLPDVRTLNVGQVSTFDANISLPPGHLLKLGEKRRFGNVEVEATKVTRGMVTYEHPAGDRWTLLPEGPVVKLWLRFRNVSKDQPIPPLDKYLVFSKTKIAGTEHFRTNSVVTTAADRRPVGYVLTHDHADKNILKGQQLSVEMPPGGTLETFIPLTPELDLPPGELLWRVHLRKGFGKAGAGVTTLIDVAFSAKDIVDDGQG